MPTDLAVLMCGHFDGASELGEVMAHMSTVLDTLSGRIEWVKAQTDDELRLFGPFIGRSILEVCFNALVARLDPFRILLLREMQRQPDYELGVRKYASVQWQGDILAAKKTQQMWPEDKRIEDFSRSLLGDYYDHLYWRFAIQRLVDAIDAAAGGVWMQELRGMNPQDFIPRIRNESTRLFSSLSKGVHHEFVVPPAALYDRATVLGLIADVLRITSHLALVSHMVLHCPFLISPNEAIEVYNRVQGIEVV